MHWHLCKNCLLFLASLHTSHYWLITPDTELPAMLMDFPSHSLLPRFFAITYCSPQPANRSNYCLVSSLKGREGKDYCLYQTAHLRLFVQHREWYQTELKQVYFVRLQCAADRFLCSCVASDSQERWLMAFLCKQMMRILETKCFGVYRCCRFGWTKLRAAKSAAGLNYLKC